jgi:hypothetical protein
MAHPLGSDIRRSRRIALHLRYSLFTLAYLTMLAWFSLRAEQLTRGGGSLAQLVITVFHVPLYAGLAFFMLQAISRGEALVAHRWTRVAATFGATGVVALLDEWVQVSILSRDPSAFRVLLDLVGVAGLLLVCGIGTAQESRR